MADLYRPDLALIHDAGYGAIARKASGLLLDTLARQRITQGLVIDLGCGSGILSEPVAAAGFDVLGYDLSASMLEIARQRVPTGDLRQESFLTAELPSCVAVCAVGEIFNYLTDPTNTKPALAKLFLRVHDALQPGGILLFDVAGPGRVVPGVSQGHRLTDDWAVLVDFAEDTRRKILTRRITSFRKVGDTYRRDEEVHQQKLYAPAEMTELLEQAGFRVRVLSRYGAFRLPRGLVGFLARKR